MLLARAAAGAVPAAADEGDSYAQVVVFGYEGPGAAATRPVWLLHPRRVA